MSTVFLLVSCSKVEDMVVAASQHPPGVEPHAQSIPSGMTSAQGSRHAAPNPYRGPNPNHLDRQHQGNWPFFYVQPSQPYLTCQWPMPMPYVPYGGFPGFGYYCNQITCSGYGMVLPPFPPASYVEAPGYILPHTQLHMVDYRRMMTPHLAPAMAYQARRFRYQHTTPSGRVMVSSEVQTEPVSANSSRQGCNVVTSTQSSSESGRSTDSSSVLSSIPNEDQAACLEKGCAVLSKMSGDTAKISTVQNGGILFQAEEVRIECSGSPSAVKITHSKETTELASNAGELLQCNMGSAEDVVLRCFQPVPFGDEERKGTKNLSHLEDPCPDILMVSCPSNGSVSMLEGSIVAPVEPVNSTLVVQGDPSLVKNAQDMCGNPNNIHFKILRLPLELQCLDELQQMEASVWSVESLMPYVPTSEWMMQNSLTPGKPSLPTVMEVPAESVLHSIQSTAAATPSLLEAGTVIELDGQGSMTSLESLPPFLPSASRLAEFGNAYFNKLSSDVQKVSNPDNMAKGQTEAHQDTRVQTGHQSPNAAPMKLKEELNQSERVEVGLNDWEACAVTLFPESPLKHKIRMCKSCSVKRSADICSGSPSSKVGCIKRHKASRALLAGDKVKVPLCATCMCAPEKKARCKVAAINAESNIAHNEVSENEVYPSKKCSKNLYKVQNPHSGKHLEKCPMPHQSKLREQNCLCEDMKALHSTSAWNKNGHGQHNDITWERNEENLALSAMDRWTDGEQRFTGEKSWRGSTQGSDSESTKSGGKMRTHNKPKRTQSLEVHRRDTRY
ncbi:hypothetical protein QTP70_019433 [Hemibagrus guttatus]|uniref:Uncharacterized protein n=1 Tax=Hemibagrus guttatus TaxID=175788 RepID=A0AAE0UYG1_9TELE|nr:hypothetical protein QTP70_019433 [Hemibagrus guttatus]